MGVFAHWDCTTEPMSAKHIHAIALVLTPCGFWHCAETFCLEKVGEMLTVFTDRARKADASFMEGNEYQSAAVIEMFAKKKRHPSGAVVQFRIDEL